MSFPSVPSVEEVSKWKRAQVLTYVQSKKDELDLDDKHIKVIEDQEIAGSDFLRLNADKLMRVGLTMGPAERIADLVNTIKGEQEGKYRDRVHLQPTYTAFSAVISFINLPH